MLRHILFACSSLFLVQGTSLAHNHQSDHDSHHSMKEQKSAIHIAHPRVRAFLPAAISTAGYFEISNHGNTPKVLVSASLEGAGKVEIHEHIHKGDMMMMQQVEALSIGVHQTVKFQPGGYHLMIFDPKDTFKVGEKRLLKLGFADGEVIEIKADIVALSDTFGKPKSHSHHH